MVALLLAAMVCAGLFYLVRFGSDTTFQPWAGYENVLAVMASPSILIGLFLTTRMPADTQGYHRLFAGAALTAVCYLIAYSIIDRALPGAFTSRFGEPGTMEIEVASHTMLSGTRLTRPCHTALQIVDAQGYDRTICTTTTLFNALQDGDRLTVSAMHSVIGRMPDFDEMTLAKAMPFRQRRQ